MENSEKKKAIAGAKKNKEPAQVHSCVMYLFIEGYCSSTITKVFAGYEENSRNLKNYMLNRQVNNPPLLAASIERSDPTEMGQ